MFIQLHNTIYMNEEGSRVLVKVVDGIHQQR